MATFHNKGQLLLEEYCDVFYVRTWELGKDILVRNIANKIVVTDQNYLI